MRRTRAQRVPLTAETKTKHSQPGEAENPTTAERNVIMSGSVVEPLMTLSDLSAMLGVPVSTLYGWRHRGEGPPGYRIGRHVRYRRSEVESWIEAQADTPKVA
jgi:excisionase family DNA binding protein